MAGYGTVLFHKMVASRDIRVKAYSLSMEKLREAESYMPRPKLTPEERRERARLRSERWRTLKFPTV
jgi:hypothetical protein